MIYLTPLHELDDDLRGEVVSVSGTNNDRVGIHDRNVNDNVGPLLTIADSRSLRPASSATQNGHYINFQAVLEFLPTEYDGYNIPASKFVRDCLFARNSVYPADKPLLLRLIRSRIIGSADAYLQDREIDSINDHLSNINSVFSPYQN